MGRRQMDVRELCFEHKTDISFIDISFIEDKNKGE